MSEKDEKKGEIILYKADSGPELQVRLENGSIWLTQVQIASLFGVNVPAIFKHVKNIIRDGELRPDRTISKKEIVRKEGKRQVKRDLDFYNLDMILSIGYRVNSKKATQFRIWATQKLRNLLLKGYVINEQRLKELHQAVTLIQQAPLENYRLDGYEKELLHIITEYTNTWIILNQFDKGDLTLSQVTKKGVKQLDYNQIKIFIERFKARLIKDKEATELFGAEVGKKLSQVLANVVQGNGEKDLYPSLDEKAARILYFTVKERPFVDGNKRIGALLFLLFLINNNYLINRKGEKKINDTALTVLTLLVASSKPDQKDAMIRLIVNLINKK